MLLLHEISPQIQCNHSRSQNRQRRCKNSRNPAEKAPYGSSPLHLFANVPRSAASCCPPPEPENPESRRRGGRGKNPSRLAKQDMSSRQDVSCLARHGASCFARQDVSCLARPDLQDKTYLALQDKTCLVSHEKEWASHGSSGSDRLT